MNFTLKICKLFAVLTNFILFCFDSTNKRVKVNSKQALNIGVD